MQFWDPRRIVAGGTLAADEGPVLILQGHQNSVISVAHSPAALLFATGSGLSLPLAPLPPPPSLSHCQRSLSLSRASVLGALVSWHAMCAT